MSMYWILIWIYFSVCTWIYTCVCVCVCVCVKIKVRKCIQSSCFLFLVLPILPHVGRRGRASSRYTVCLEANRSSFYSLFEFSRTVYPVNFMVDCHLGRPFRCYTWRYHPSRLAGRQPYGGSTELIVWPGFWPHRSVLNTCVHVFICLSVYGSGTLNQNSWNFIDIRWLFRFYFWYRDRSLSYLPTPSHGQDIT